VVVSFHRVSGICKTRIHVCETLDHTRSNFSIEQRGIIGRVLWVLEGSDKGFEEHFISSGIEGEGPVGAGMP